MKLNNVVLKITTDIATVDTNQVFREISRDILKSFNLSDDSFINNDGQWAVPRFSSHAFVEVIRPVTSKEVEIMNAFRTVQSYYHTKITKPTLPVSTR